MSKEHTAEEAKMIREAVDTLDKIFDYGTPVEIGRFVEAMIFENRLKARLEKEYNERHKEI